MMNTNMRVPSNECSVKEFQNEFDETTTEITTSPRNIYNKTRKCKLTKRTTILSNLTTNQSRLNLSMIILFSTMLAITMARPPSKYDSNVKYTAKIFQSKRELYSNARSSLRSIVQNSNSVRQSVFGYKSPLHKQQNTSTKSDLLRELIAKRNSHSIDRSTFSSELTRINESQRFTLVDAATFLDRYGYLSSAKGRTSADTKSLPNKEHISRGIKMYQFYNRLPTTGRLDDATVNLMQSPRCGNADVESDDNGRPKRYSLAHGFETTSQIVYRIDNAPSSAEGTDEVHTKLRRVIADALTIWQTHIPIDFVHEREAGVDADVAFEFSFYRGNHNDGSSFDGNGGVLGHAFYPDSPRAGQVHFDGDEVWLFEQVVETVEDFHGRQLLNVAVHEIGHALGLRHSSDEAAIMYAAYKARTGVPSLTIDDVAGVQNLYGRRDRPMPTTTITPIVVTFDPITVCGGHIDAAMRLYSDELQTTVLIQGDHMYEMSTADDGTIVLGDGDLLSTSIFGLAPGQHVESAFTNAMQYTRLHVDGVVYEFDTYDKFDVTEQHRGVSFREPGLFYKSMSETATASLAADEDASTIFVFDGPKYYAIDSNGGPSGRTVRNVRDIHDELGEVDAAVRMHDSGRLFLFSGDMYVEVELYGNDMLKAVDKPLELNELFNVCSTVQISLTTVSPSTTTTVNRQKSRTKSWKSSWRNGRK